jgi:hypothetical protein
VVLRDPLVGWTALAAPHIPCPTDLPSLAAGSPDSAVRVWALPRPKVIEVLPRLMCRTRMTPTSGATSGSGAMSDGRRIGNRVLTYLSHRHEIGERTPPAAKVGVRIGRTTGSI